MFYSHKTYRFEKDRRYCSEECYNARNERPETMPHAKRNFGRHARLDQIEGRQ